MSSASLDAMMSAMSSMSAQMSSMSQAIAALSTATPTPTVMAAMAMPMSTSAMSMSMGGGSSGGMSGMDMGGSSGGGMSGMDMGGGGQCKLDMAWNWNTIDSCFLSRGWHVKTRGQFAGTCIGIFLWVAFLLVLARARRSLDTYIMSNGKRKHLREMRQQGGALDPPLKGRRTVEPLQCTDEPLACDAENLKELTTKLDTSSFSQQTDRLMGGSQDFESYRPNIYEQVLRALLYGFEYSITWLIALIMMSFNGYVIISASLGAFLGFLIVNWERMKPMGNEPFTAQPVCC